MPIGNYNARVAMNAFSAKKEWIGESGYCNCLLVTMARTKISEVEINSRKNVPNLEELSKNSPETYEWIKAQEFDYANIRSSEVIEILCSSANMKASIFGKKSGIIYATDLEKKTGPKCKGISSTN
jgi:hypothetical protein